MNKLRNNPDFIEYQKLVKTYEIKERNTDRILLDTLSLFMFTFFFTLSNCINILYTEMFSVGVIVSLVLLCVDVERSGKTIIVEKGLCNN